MKTITIQISSTPAPNPRIGTYCIVKNDYDQKWPDEFKPYDFHVSRNTRNGTAYGTVSGRAVPATATFLNDRNVAFTCNLQYWIHTMNCERGGFDIDNARAKADFKSMFRDNAFITNYAGTHSREDCINRTHVGDGWPQIQPMATGGSLLKVNGQIRKFGEDAWLIDAINPSYFNDYHYKSHSWLFFFPAQSARKWYNKDGIPLEDVPDSGDKIPARKEEHYQEPLWFYNEKCVVPIFGTIPNSKSSTGWSAAIPMWRTRILENEEPIPNPYIMRDDRILPNPYRY